MPAQTPSQCLSVVIPCYNEKTTIHNILKRVLDSPWTGEVIIVDDGSTDGTREELEKIDEPRVRVILQPKNGGKGSAVRRGYQDATLDYVVVQDADLEYDPEEYGKLIRMRLVSPSSS